MSRSRRRAAPPTEMIARVAGPRSIVEVYRRGDYRCMRFAGGGGLVQGRRHVRAPLDFGSPYLASMCAAALSVPDPRHALVLGLGVGALPRLLRVMWPELAVHVVEIDPAVIQAADAYFDCRPGAGLRIVEADAAEFVRRPPPGPPYDLVLLDCYDDRRLPPALTEPAFVRRLLDLLAPGAMLVANLVRSRPGAGELGPQLAVRLCGAHVIPVPGRSNRVWFGGRSRAPEPSMMARRAATVVGRLPFDVVPCIARSRAVHGDSAPGG